MRALCVVLSPILLRFSSHLRKISPQVTVQTLVAQLSVEALDVRVLRRFSGLDIVPLDPSRLGPALHVRRDKLRSVVAAYRLRTASLLTQPLQHPRHIQPRKSRRDFDTQTFPRAVVDDVEQPDFAPISEAVLHEIERPALVRTTARQKHTPRPAALLPTILPPQVQTLFAIQTMHAFLVHPLATPSQKCMQPPISVTRALLRQCAQQPSQSLVRTPLRTISHAGPRNA